MKILVDMCLTPRWIEVFRRAEISATHWSSVGRATTRDTEIMRFAADHEYVVLTHDLDFGSADPRPRFWCDPRGDQGWAPERRATSSPGYQP